jgi:hypothetical protein
LRLILVVVLKIRELFQKRFTPSRKAAKDRKSFNAEAGRTQSGMNFTQSSYSLALRALRTLREITSDFPNPLRDLRASALNASELSALA